jgi:hypothetical protein
MFDVEARDRKVSVQTRDGRRASLRVGDILVELTSEGRKLQVPRDRPRVIVGRLVGLLRPGHADLIEQMIERDELVPDPPLTFEFLRLFGRLRPLFDAWEASIEPLVVTVQRRLVEVLGAFPEIGFERELYEDEQLCADLLRWRAAVLAISPAASTDDPIASLRNWRGIYSSDGRPYRSLNRTLSQLSPGVDDDLVLYGLPGVRLERPMTDSVELTTLLCLGWLVNKGWVGAAPEGLVHLLAHARRAEIENALVVVLGPQPKAPPGRNECSELVSCLLSAPSMRGSLVGVTRQASRARELRRYLRRVEFLGGWEAPTAEPAIPLPDVKEIRFLRTIREVYDEGAAMNHCVADYIEDAVRGNTYLFHVEFKGLPATIAIGRSGFVHHVNGPNNQSNEACEWAERAFEVWRRGDQPMGTPNSATGQLGFGFAVSDERDDEDLGDPKVE